MGVGRCCCIGNWIPTPGGIGNWIPTPDAALGRFEKKTEFRSFTLNFASTIEDLAAGTTVDLHRLMVDFVATGKRILDDCNAMTDL
jgi:hypothetical protein